MKSVFVVFIENQICHCGETGIYICCSFEKKEDAEDFCKQFNKENDIEGDVESDAFYERAKADIREIRLYSTSVIYEKAKP